MSYNGEEISDQEWDAADRDQFGVEAEEPAPVQIEDAIQASEVKKAMAYNGRAVCDWKGARDTLAAEVHSLRSQLARKDEGMRMALEEAAQSLEALAGLAGKDETMLEYDQVRGYALNRAMAARAALREPDGRKGE